MAFTKTTTQPAPVLAWVDAALPTVAGGIDGNSATVAFIDSSLIQNFIRVEIKQIPDVVAVLQAVYADNPTLQ